MHAEIHIPLSASSLHPGEVGIEDVEVDEQSRRVEIIDAGKRGHGGGLSKSENVQVMIRLHFYDALNIQYAEFARFRAHPVAAGEVGEHRPSGRRWHHPRPDGRGSPMRGPLHHGETRPGAQSTIADTYSHDQTPRFRDRRL